MWRHPDDQPPPEREHDPDVPFALVGQPGKNPDVDKPRLDEIAVDSHAMRVALSQGWCVVIRSDMFDAPKPEKPIEPAQSGPQRDFGDERPPDYGDSGV